MFVHETLLSLLAIERSAELLNPLMDADHGTENRTTSLRRLWFSSSIPDGSELGHSAASRDAIPTKSSSESHETAR